MYYANIAEVPDLIELCHKSGNNLLIVGDPGVGKSSVIKSMENDHRKVTMMTGSSTYEETVNGIPRDNKELNVQDYTRPSWFVDLLEWSAQHPDDYQILFLDEFNTAEPQVLKTFLTILSDRKIPTQPEPLPDNVVLVAAMNPPSQNEGTELIRPMASRFLTCFIKSDIDNYLLYLQGKSSLTHIKWMFDTENPVPTYKYKEFFDQISTDDWQKFEEGNYHELNPRSFSNFLRALNVVADKKRFCPKISSLAFGFLLSYPEDTEVKERKAEERKARIVNGSVVPTDEELQKMDDAALESLLPIMTKKGNLSCVARIKRIQKERANKKED